MSNSFARGMSITDDVEVIRFANNRFFNNQLAGMQVHPENVPQMDGNSDYSGGAFPNGIPMLEIMIGSHKRGQVYQWKNRSSPYFLAFNYRATGGIWRIDAGVEIVMDEDLEYRSSVMQRWKQMVPLQIQ